MNWKIVLERTMRSLVCILQSAATCSRLVVCNVECRTATAEALAG